MPPSYILVRAAGMRRTTDRQTDTQTAVTMQYKFGVVCDSREMLLAIIRHQSNRQFPDEPGLAACRLESASPAAVLKETFIWKVAVETMCDMYGRTFTLYAYSSGACGKLNAFFSPAC